MDIYEFTQLLWRRKWILLVGFTLLILSVAFVTFDFTSGMKPRVTPKYQADVRMAVIPAGYDSLEEDLGSDPLSGTAQVFSSLLSSPQAALEISEREGIRILEFEVGANGRDRFLTASVLAETPEAAVAGSLGAFTWLEQRLNQPLQVAALPTTPTTLPEILDTDGRFRGTVRLEADHALAADADGLWIVAETDVGTEFAYRLADAANEPSAEYLIALTPGDSIAIRLEDATGTALDSLMVDVPPLPKDTGVGYEFLLDLDRGLVRGTRENPSLDTGFVDASWIPTGPTSVLEEQDVSDVSLLLLTDVPVPLSIGGRKAPLIAVALVTAGTIALLVVAVIADSWSQERRRRKIVSEPPHDVESQPSRDVARRSPTLNEGDEIDEILRRVTS